jgi:hypothetical protein
MHLFAVKMFQNVQKYWNIWMVAQNINAAIFKLIQDRGAELFSEKHQILRI